MRRAAMLALWVGDDYLILRGERAIANGWFQRAARILERLETCPEHGWLDALLGYVATIDGDLEEAKKLAVQARALGQKLDVVSLEMFALAVEGLALVNEGEIADGMRCLDIQGMQRRDQSFRLGFRMCHVIVRDDGIEWLQFQMVKRRRPGPPAFAGHDSDRIAARP